MKLSCNQRENIGTELKIQIVQPVPHVRDRKKERWSDRTDQNKSRKYHTATKSSEKELPITQVRYSFSFFVSFVYYLFCSILVLFLYSFIFYLVFINIFYIFAIFCHFSFCASTRIICTCVRIICSCFGYIRSSCQTNIIFIMQTSLYETLNY